MKRIVYLCDWLPPDFGAIGQYALIACRDYAEAGTQVTLVGLTSGAPSVSNEAHEAGNLSIIRVWSSPVERSGLAKRLWWTLKTDLRLISRAWSALRRADEILFTGSPPFLLHFLVPANLLLRRRLIYRIADFHPEGLMATMDRPSLLLRWLQWVTVRLRRRVHQFQVISYDQIPLLRAAGIDDNRIELKRDASPVKFSGDEEPLPIPKELGGRVLLLYSGNWGVAHETSTFIEGYRLHHVTGTGRVGLWLNAQGKGAQEVEEALLALGLPVARSQPVAMADLPRLLSTPAAHLITLRNAFVGLVMPSKVYGCIDSGRRVIFIGSDRSDVDLLCRERMHDLGDYRRIEVGDVNEVAAALEQIADAASTGTTRREERAERA